jgi:hypothetical protein
MWRAIGPLHLNFPALLLFVMSSSISLTHVIGCRFSGLKIIFQELPADRALFAVIIGRNLL